MFFQISRSLLSHSACLHALAQLSRSILSHPACSRVDFTFTPLSLHMIPCSSRVRSPLTLYDSMQFSRSLLSRSTCPHTDLASAPSPPSKLSSSTRVSTFPLSSPWIQRRSVTWSCRAKLIVVQVLTLKGLRSGKSSLSCQLGPCVSS